MEADAFLQNASKRSNKQRLPKASSARPLPRQKSMLEHSGPRNRLAVLVSRALQGWGQVSSQTSTCPRTRFSSSAKFPTTMAWKHSRPFSHATLASKKCALCLVARALLLLNM